MNPYVGYLGAVNLPQLRDAAKQSPQQQQYRNVIGEEFGGAALGLVIGLVRWLPSLLFSYTVVPISQNINKKTPGWKRLPSIFIFSSMFNLISAVTIRAIVKLTVKMKGSGEIALGLGANQDPEKYTILPKPMELLAMFIGSALVDFIALIINVKGAQAKTGIRKPLIYPLQGRELEKTYKTTEVQEKKKEKPNK